MATMQTRKSIGGSAVNYLTKSYDMSIRSLMSGELNLLKSSNTEISPADLPTLSTRQSLTDAAFGVSLQDAEYAVSPSVGAHLVLDNKALSPKYLSSSPHTKTKDTIKLITTRSGQQKKASPSKDTGPPQPIKAIHSLPPSLTPSRENTSESLGPRSPGLVSVTMNFEQRTTDGQSESPQTESHSDSPSPAPVTSSSGKL